MNNGNNENCCNIAEIILEIPFKRYIFEYFPINYLLFDYIEFLILYIIYYSK